MPVRPVPVTSNGSSPVVAGHSGSALVCCLHPAGRSDSLSCSKSRASSGATPCLCCGLDCNINDDDDDDDDGGGGDEEDDDEEEEEEDDDDDDDDDDDENERNRRQKKKVQSYLASVSCVVAAAMAG